MQVRSPSDLRNIGRRPDPSVLGSGPFPGAPGGPPPVAPLPAPAGHQAPAGHWAVAIPVGAPPPPYVAVPVGAPPPAVTQTGARAGRMRRVYPDHLVQWGVPREPFRFDIEDPAEHRGRVQHAYPLGNDAVAVCGFETPLVRSFMGGKAPLLALAGPESPRCRSCAAVVVPAPPHIPHVSPYAVERRYDALSWLDDRMAALGLPPQPRVRKEAPGPRPMDPPWPEVDRPLLRLMEGPRPPMGAAPTSEAVAPAPQADVPVVPGPIAEAAPTPSEEAAA